MRLLIFALSLITGACNNVHYKVNGETPVPEPEPLTCAAGTYIVDNSCVDVGVGFYSTGSGERFSCTNLPAHGSYNSATASSSNCPFICAAGFYNDNAGGCTDVGVGHFSTGDGVRQDCSNGPANASYFGITNTTSSCKWECDTNYYSSDGVSCTSLTNYTETSCPANHIITGIYGRSGAVLDQMGIWCRPFNGTIFTGPTIDGGVFGTSTGGWPFNNDNSMDCPDGSYISSLDTVSWLFWTGDQNTSWVRYKCTDLTTNIEGGFIPDINGQGDYNGGGGASNQIINNFYCGSTANPIGTHMTKLIGVTTTFGMTPNIYGISCK